MPLHARIYANQISRNPSISERRLTFLEPHKSQSSKCRFATYILACFFVRISRKPIILEKRLTLSKKKFENTVKSKSHPAISPDTTYLAFFVLFSVLPECLPEANSDQIVSCIHGVDQSVMQSRRRIRSFRARCRSSCRCL